ncbi:MAG: YigZ family protein [Oscillospiraceae bacterium]|nr:YigZ family protein [Oscillospiraceae bacterium]
MPILEVLRHSGLEDVIIVVVRYFGGTLLGTGGLVRAYTQAAQAAVASAEILSYSLCVDLSIEIDYPLYDKLLNICQNNGAKVMDTQYTDKVFVKVRMVSGTQDNLVNEIEILTKGRKPDISREIYDIF